MRTFVAVDLDRESRGAAASLIRRAGREAEGVRWVRPENIHVTLRFLGETAPERCALVEKALRETAALFPPFTATLSVPGAFPSRKRPRVLWVGLERGVDELRRIHSALEERLERVGFPREGRRYTPHVTVGRLRRRPGGGNLRSFFESARLDAGFVVDRLRFVESRLTPEGAVYGTLFEAHLSGGDPPGGDEGAPGG